MSSSFPTAPGERAVVLLDQRAEARGNLIGALEPRLGARLLLDVAPEREFERLEALDHRTLKARDLLGVVVAAAGFELAQSRDQPVQALDVASLPRKLAPQCLGGLATIAELAPELARVVRRETTAPAARRA